MSVHNELYKQEWFIEENLINPTNIGCSDITLKNPSLFSAFFLPRQFVILNQFLTSLFHLSTTSLDTHKASVAIKAEIYRDMKSILVVAFRSLVDLAEHLEVSSRGATSAWQP